MNINSVTELQTFPYLATNNSAQSTPRPEQSAPKATRAISPEQEAVSFPNIEVFDRNDDGKLDSLDMVSSKTQLGASTYTTAYKLAEQAHEPKVDVVL